MKKNKFKIGDIVKYRYDKKEKFMIVLSIYYEHEAVYHNFGTTHYFYSIYPFSLLSYHEDSLLKIG